MIPEDDQDLTRISPVHAAHAEDDTRPTKPVTTDVPAPEATNADDATVVKPLAHVPVTTVERAAVGVLLKERFLLQRELGRGGMGVVYLARDERKVEAHDRDPYIAVKVLNDEFRRHPDSLVALQREARRTQRLGHANIVRVYDFDRHADIVFMTMEYIDGSDLRRLIREDVFGGLTLRRAWPLIEGMAQGLQHAHDNGVVHSDFKPGNVMVNREGVAKVFDFGIARAGKFGLDANTTHDADHTVFDARSLNALTPAYASPEVTGGQLPMPADDIYALGCVIYELLTGAHPYGKTGADEAMHQGLRPPHVRKLSRRQARVLRDSVSFDRHRRPRSAVALLDGLRHRGWRERTSVWLPAVVALLLIVALAGWGGMRYLQTQRNERVAAAFAAGATHPFVDETQAMQALSTLDDEDRARLVLANNERIGAFFLTRIDTYWKPSAGREDYAGAQRIFDLRDRLKLFSPALDAHKVSIEKEHNDLLNALDSQLRDAVAAGSLGDDTHGAARLIQRIRVLDPGGARLEDDAIELKYEAAIAHAFDDKDTAKASLLLATASQLFPRASRLAAWRQHATAVSPAVASSVPAPSITLPSGDETLAAEVASGIESVRRAAAAGDTTKAQAALDGVKKLQPANPFVTTDGPRLISAAYLQQAHDQARHGHWQEAAQTLRGGMGWLGRRADLRGVLERYDLVATIVPLLDGSGTIDEAAATDIEKRASTLRRNDPKGLRQLDAEIREAAGKAGITFDTLLAAVKQRSIHPSEPAVVGQQPSSASSDGLAKTHGDDPCNSITLAGSGKTCVDTLSDGSRGPAMVVIPTGEGQRAFALSRNLVTVAEFNRYCDNAEHCAPLSGDGGGVAQKLYLAQARMYASWLSRMSGYAYRLPNDQEWKRAMSAGASCPSADNKSRLPARTAWGLAGADGPLGEWVTSSGHTLVRSGAKGPCDDAPRQDDRGLPQAEVGFRLVRTLK